MEPMQAAPYLKRDRPVSNAGLAVIIVDHAHPLMLGVGQEIRMPARCTHTEEPALITARLIQLGAVAVVRMTPEKSIKVEEVATNVFRAIIYKDEVDVPWEKVCQNPIRFVIDHTPLLKTSGSQSPIIDCWDRQFLSEKMSRVKPQDAYQFLVAFRVQGIVIPGLLKHSGTNQVYSTKH